MAEHRHREATSVPAAGGGPERARAASAAAVLVDRLQAYGVRRLYGLTGGHIKPIWDAAARAGIDIVGVRHEAAAVHMAHAAAELTGSLAVATVTAGPGMTNALTGIAAAHYARVPVLVISALAPRPQLGRGAFEETPQLELAAPVTRSATTVMDPAGVVEALDAAVADALGGRGMPGPAYLDLPADVLRAPVTIAGPTRVPELPPHPAPVAADVRRAATLVAGARRPLVISGSDARGAADELLALVRRIDGLYLDTRESRGLLPIDIDQYVPAMRARAMRESDLIITVGRRLDYELAYGSPAVFGEHARFLRIGHDPAHTSDNRHGDAQILADIGASSSELAAALPELGLDLDWVHEIREANASRTARLHETMPSQPPGEDGLMHPYRLLAAVNTLVGADTVTVADGGDILSFAAVGLAGRRLLTPGSFGCLGVGVPFAVAAAIECPGRRVVAVIGDGAFGFNAMEVATAVAQQAKVVFVVANNQAWGIERWDRIRNYDDAPFSTELPGCRYDLLAQALGAYGEHVDDPDQLDAALRRSLDNAPAVLDVSVTRDAMSPDFRNGLAELCDHQALRTWNDLEVAWRSTHPSAVPPTGG